MCLFSHWLFFKNQGTCEFADIFQVSPQASLTKGKSWAEQRQNTVANRHLNSFSQSFLSVFIHNCTWGPTLGPGTVPDLEIQWRKHQLKFPSSGIYILLEKEEAVRRISQWTQARVSAGDPALEKWSKETKLVTLASKYGCRWSVLRTPQWSQNFPSTMPSLLWESHIDEMIGLSVWLVGDAVSAVSWGSLRSSRLKAASLVRFAPLFQERVHLL